MKQLAGNLIETIGIILGTKVEIDFLKDKKITMGMVRDGAVAGLLITTGIIIRK